LVGGGVVVVYTNDAVDGVGAFLGRAGAGASGGPKDPPFR
jgi:hypothetical protein